VAFEWTYNGLRYRLSDHEPRRVEEFARGAWKPSFQANALFGLRAAAAGFDRVNAENAALRRALEPFARRRSEEQNIGLHDDERSALADACRLMGIDTPDTRGED